MLPSIKESIHRIYKMKQNYQTTTMAWFAMKDSSRRYRTWHKSWINNALEKSFTCTHTDIARVFYRKFWLDFAYDSRSKLWYEYCEHQWKVCDLGLGITSKISNKLCESYEDAKTSLERSLLSCHKNERHQTELKIKNIKRTIVQLKDVTVKSKLLVELREFFCFPGLHSVMDSNPNITGMKNGVIQVNSQLAFFRDGKPEDWVTKSTFIDYLEYSWSDPLMSELANWIGQVFPDPTLSNHFMKFSASLLEAGNKEKIFPIWTGSGDNSKSMIVKLFENSFGDYNITFPISMISDKALSNTGPSPELARARGTRIAFLTEPDDDINLKKGIIKKFTGNDKFFARKLHQNGEYIKPTFTMIMMCNRVPCIPCADEAVVNRTRVLPFLSKWTDDAPEDPEEQQKQRRFKKDRHFDLKIPKFASGFLWIIVQWFATYRAQGLGVPELVEAWTKEYWEESDKFKVFISENVVKLSEGEQSHREYKGMPLSASITDLYVAFTAWHKKNFPSTPIPTRMDFAHQLKSYWGLPTAHGVWKGVIIQNKEDHRHELRQYLERLTLTPPPEHEDTYAPFRLNF